MRKTTTLMSQRREGVSKKIYKYKFMESQKEKEVVHFYAAKISP